MLYNEHCKPQSKSNRYQGAVSCAGCVRGRGGSIGQETISTGKMPVVYGPQPLNCLNTETRHGFDEQYSSEQLLESLANGFIFYFDDKRHRSNGNPMSEEEKQQDAHNYYQPILDWKIVKERQKTVSAALLLCLNLGVDPPDVIKTHPCARLESWVDPHNFQDSKKAIEQIGKNLQAQYETLSLRTRYKQSLDPCVEDVKRFCNSLRRASKDERILFHYNGHGVPQPTPSGEIWVFNRGYTQYIPVSLYDLQTWLGAPCIYVWDCNSAGNIVSNFQKFVQKRIKDDQDGNHDMTAPSSTQAYIDCVQLAACRSGELLPMNPELPADLFTCCLTDPIEISVKIFLMQSPLKDTKYSILFQNDDSRYGSDNLNRMPNISIPGKLSERRTPLGELNWIFTAITDTIAWTSLPRPLFKKLFRHDLMVAALFRSFLLAKRIMPWYNCNPVSDPVLPDNIAEHPMWKSWDLAIDEVLTKLVDDMHHNMDNGSGKLEVQALLQQRQGPVRSETSINGMPESLNSRNPMGNLSTMSLANMNNNKASSSNPSIQSSSSSALAQGQQQQFTKFFEQHLTAFELWLKYGANTRHPPEQLPIVLQVLLSQVHRVRTLVLLSRFLDLGPWAVYLSLSIGIFPYVLKLLQSPAQELKPILVFIWARIMSIDYKNTQTELVKEKGYLYFVKMLVPEWGTQRPASNTGSPLTLTAPVNINVQRASSQVNPGNTTAVLTSNTTDEQKAMATFVLSSFVNDFPLGQKYCFSQELVQKLCYYVDNSEVPLLRQWCIILIGQLYLNNPLHKSICLQEMFLARIIRSLKDPIPEIRCAALLSMKYFCSDYDDADLILKLHQECQQQIPQLQSRLQQFQTTSQQAQQQQQQLHIQQQQFQVQQQLQQVQSSMVQLQHVDIKQLKREEIKMISAALVHVNDGSPMVRKELIIFISQVVERYITFFIVIAFNELTEEIITLEFDSNEANDLKRRTMVGHGSIFNTVWKALLILAADPFTENSILAGDVIDYILIKLKDHPDLGEIVTEMEKYLIKRTANSHPSGLAMVGMAATKLPTPKRPISLGAYDKSRPTPSAKKTPPSSQRSYSLSGLLKSLRLTTEEQPAASITNANKKHHLSLLSVPYGVAPIPPTPNYKKRTGPLVMPLKSMFLEYCREYFQEPQMKKKEADEPGSVEYTARLWRRNRNEQIIQETQAQKQLSLYGDWSRKVASVDNKTQPKILRLMQFESYLVSSDDRDNVAVYDWEENKHLARFSNGNPFGTKITDMKFLNEDDVPLLLTGSSDGIVKIYKDFNCLENIELISSWRGLTDLLLTPKSTGLLTEWQQSRGSLLATGDVKIIRVWDALTESVEVDVPAKSSSLITSLTSDQLSGNIFVSGFSDGSIRVYDRRVDPRDSMVRLWKPSGGRPISWITNVHLQRGGYRELVSGTNNGVVELWDIRQDKPVLTFTDSGQNGGNGYNSSPPKPTTMTSIHVHEHAPVIATGTKHINIWTTSGDSLCTFKNNGSSHVSSVAGSLATGISVSRSSTSFISSMAFHPHRMMLAAANSHDTNINIYQCRDARNDYSIY
ncbi:ADR331Cp [Eremothecium gossypii ATCC 10895]|uniref:ADR331Cp n=1 Tax=Eremothecium gossypii (strain ATCC 10895 / CBS 109.51 / FGSC 9923 / NRRL Y-1056) TaxID=284811 RepID=Q759E6_EREGS|nr:ADR331Cp [Eremothecium gossypii ATCC 10895]AAS52251.2 ADR331Cp [Eremothecium gossypii ATCC 10895]AEY96550.1 FADR331Cp [Eremothecium gossypii FDAG1]